MVSHKRCAIDRKCSRTTDRHVWVWAYNEGTEWSLYQVISKGGGEPDDLQLPEQSSLLWWKD
eukprot:4081702-Ditylum_brightwellii.AAC.1